MQPDVHNAIDLNLTESALIVRVNSKELESTYIFCLNKPTHTEVTGRCLTKSPQPLLCLGFKLFKDSNVLTSVFLAKDLSAH